MDSIVEELERDVTSGNSSLSDALRKARVIASKLDLQQPLEWVDSELNGYRQQVPNYRMSAGQLKVDHPLYGWQPFLIKDSIFERKVTNYSFQNPVREIEYFVEGSGTVLVSLSGKDANVLCCAAHIPTLPMAVFHSKGAMVRIFRCRSQSIA